MKDQTMQTESNHEVGTTEFCRNYPKQPVRLLARDNIFEYVETVFKDVAKCILLEGEPQSGKSVLLANYMLKHPQDSVGVFLSPGDTYFYSPEYARIVLAEQISWIVNGKPGNFDSLDETTYKSLLYKLQKVAKQRVITFVLDGLAEKNSSENRLKAEILNLLPFSQQDFRFLISGSADLEAELRQKCKAFKAIPLIQISQEEATEFFGDIPDLSPKDISDIRKLCAGSIGRMEKLKAIIKTKRSSLDDILNNQGGQLEDLMELEWSNIDEDEPQKRPLAFLSFANRPLKIDRLAQHTGIPEKTLQDSLIKNSFIEIDSTNSCSIRSTPQKAFLRGKLQQYEKEVQESLLAELLENPESVESDRHLPAQLMRTGRYDDLVRRLDIRHFCRLLSSEKSLRALRSNLDLGLKAAKQLGDEALVTQFSMGKSVVGGVTLSVGSQSRIEALVAIGNTDEAIELSLAAPTREERLKYLSATAKSLYDERKSIPADVRNEIRELLDELSIEALGDMAIPIACDLIVVDFEAAVSLFNKANAVVNKEKSSSAITNQEKSGERATEGVGVAGDEGIQIRMSEKHHKRFSQALGQMIDRTPAESLLKRLQQSTDYSTNLVFLKEWIGRRRTDPAAGNVANLAVDLILKDLTRAPRIEDLRAIAVVLPHMADVPEAEKLSKRIQTLVSTDLLLGNSVEAIRLHMLISETQHRISPAEAEFSILDRLLDVESIEDLGIRVACLSWMLYALKQFVGWDLLEERTSLISHTTRELMTAIESLLSNSADHFAAVKTALPALVRADPALALRVSNSLNTASRRDSAHSMLVSELFVLMRYAENPEHILRSVDGIIDENVRSTSILRGLSMAVEHLKSGRTTQCNEAVANLWRRLRVSNYRFMGLRHALQIAHLTSQSSSKIDLLKGEIHKCWINTEIDWVRWQLGYSLVRDTYSCDKEYSKEWLKRLSEEERSLQSPSESVSDVLKLISSMAVRAYSYLAPEEYEASEDFSKLSNLISAIAVPDERMLMWCELGIRLFYAGKTSLSKHICKYHVEPLLPIGKPDRPDQVFSDELTLAQATPFLYLIHEASGQFAVDKISCRARHDSAIEEICFTLLRKTANTDVYKDPGDEGYEIDTETATSVVSLLGKVSTDVTFFNILEAITCSLSARKNERRIRRVQVVDFLRTLEVLAEKTLPDQNNIRHRGFLISSLALINKARQAIGTQVAQSTWKDLYADARALTNASDRAVVTAFVAVGAKGRSMLVPDDWLDQIKSDIAASPTVLDRIDRCAWLAEILENFDKKQSLIFARQGMSLTRDVGPEVNVYDRKKKLLDIVFNIDPELADDFIELADGDRARKNEKSALEARIKLQRLQKEAASDPEKMELSEESDRDVSELSMRNLAALNANRIAPRAIESFKNLNSRAQSLPFASAYCVWSWILENSIRKGGANSRGDKVVANAFKASLNCGDLITSLLRGTENALNPNGFSINGLVRPGGRDEAMSLISDWARSIDGEPIIISDPYFGPDDVDLLFEISKAAPQSNFRVLTSRRHLKSIVPDGNFETAFSDTWRSICYATSSEIEIGVVAATSAGDHPIHDRWILGRSSGLRLGTSANALGSFRVSEVSHIEKNDLPDRLDLVEGLFDRRIRNWEGGKVTVSSFSLV